MSEEPREEQQPADQQTPAAPEERAQPKYGMLLPEGASIEDFIVPRTPRGNPPESDTRQDGTPQEGTPRGYPPQDAHAPYASQPGYQQPPRPQYPQYGHPPGEQSGYGQQFPQQQGHGWIEDFAQSPRLNPLPFNMPEEQARRRRRKRAVIVAVLSALGVVLLPIIGVTIGTLQVLGDNADAVVSSVPFQNGGTVHLPEDETRVISSLGAEELDQCTVTDPSGSSLDVEAVTGSPTRENTAALPGARFQTTQEGSYTISCADVKDDARMLIGPPVIVNNAVGTSVWMYGGLFLGAVSLAFFVWSLVVLRRTRRPRHQ